MLSLSLDYKVATLSKQSGMTEGAKFTPEILMSKVSHEDGSIVESISDSNSQENSKTTQTDIIMKTVASPQS